MNTKKYILLIALMPLLFSPLVSTAKTFSDLKVKFSDDINKDCYVYNSSIFSGCYHTTSSGVHEIVIRKDLPPVLFPRVFVHEFGHFLTEDIGDEELAKLFPPPLVWTNEREYVADVFVLWFFGVKLSPEQDKFFNDLLSRI